VTILNSLEVGLRSLNNVCRTQLENKVHDNFVLFLNTSFYYSQIYSQTLLRRSVSLYVGTHFPQETANFNFYDYMLPSLGVFEKNCCFFNKFGDLNKLNAIISSSSSQQLEEWKIIFLMFRLFYNLNFSFNFHFIHQYLLKLHPCNYVYFYNSIGFSILNLNFFDLRFFNVPMVTTIPDLIYNSNLMAKNSLLMHLSYESYYNEQRSIFF